jgi:hypothetical protein
MYQAGNIAGSNGATRKAIKVRTKYPSNERSSRPSRGRLIAHLYSLLRAFVEHSLGSRVMTLLYWLHRITMSTLSVAKRAI